MASEPQSPDAPRHAQPPHDAEAVAGPSAHTPAPAPLIAGEPELAPPSTPHPSVINPPDAHAPVDIDEVLLYTPFCLSVPTPNSFAG